MKLVKVIKVNRTIPIIAIERAITLAHKKIGGIACISQSPDNIKPSSVKITTIADFSENDFLLAYIDSKGLHICMKETYVSKVIL